MVHVHQPLFYYTFQPSHIPSHLRGHQYISPWQASCCKALLKAPSSNPVLFSIIQDRVEETLPAVISDWTLLLTVTATNKPKLQSHNLLISDSLEATDLWTFQRLQISWGQNSGCFDFHCAANHILSLYLFFSPKSAASVLAVLLVVQQCGSGSLGCMRLQHTDLSAHLSWSDIFILFPLLCLIRPIRSDHLRPETNHTIRVNTQCWAATCHNTPKNKRHLMP